VQSEVKQKVSYTHTHIARECVERERSTGTALRRHIYFRKYAHTYILYPCRFGCMLLPIHISIPARLLHIYAARMQTNGQRRARGGAKTPEWEHNRNNARRGGCFVSWQWQMSSTTLNICAHGRRGCNAGGGGGVYVLRTNLRITCAGGWRERRAAPGKRALPPEPPPRLPAHSPLSPPPPPLLLL
jgi:hypothetical protein